MKKGLFSILASALLVVGCQNYDDQFSNLESQISALATTVAGLSQVQSDLSSLAGTVNSLSSTVNGLGAEIDTAVADGLADIQADIEAIETAVADVASSEEVSDLSDAVAASQEDLDELLANSSVFNGDVTINSEATLAAFKSIGSGLAIVNGNVNITVSTAMNQADVQTVVDEILTVTKDFTYTAAASTIAETTFNNLSGVQSLTLKQGGGYQAKGLVSASNIFLNDAYKSTVTIVDFRALTSVSTIQDDNGTAGTIKFNKATEMHLTSLAYYPGANLNLQVKKGGVIDITALDDLNALGTAVGSTYALTLDGPASASNASIGDGTLTFTNVATVNVTGFIGDTVIGAGVETLTVDGAVAIDISAAADLVTANITGALDSDATLTTADTAGPAITFASTDLTTATIGGVVASINATEQSNLETLTITADTKGGALTVDDNDDLVTVTVTGAKLGNVTIMDNGDLETVTLDHTTTLATADKGATVSVTGNANMTSLSWSADDVDSLTISNNTQLATINFEGLKDLGTSTSATADIQGNALVSTTTKNQYDATPATTDRGSYTSVSGMVTLKTWLTAAMAATTKNIGVYFDTIELSQTQASATAAYVDAAHTDAVTGTGINAVAYAVTTAAAGTTIRETQTYVMDQAVNALNAPVTATAATKGITLDLGGVSADFKPAAASTIAAVVSSINGATDWGSAYSVTAAQDAYKKSIQTVNYLTSDGSTAATVVSNGNLYYTFGTTSGTIALATGATNLDIVQALATAISAVHNSDNKWNASANGNDEIIVYNTVSKTGYPSELGSGGAAFPTLTFTVDTAQTSTTAQLSQAASNTAALASNTFFLNVQKDDITGVRITMVNESTSTAGTFVAPTEDTAGLGSVTQLVSGTNTVGVFSQIAAFSDVSTQTPASTATKNRISWL